MIQVCEQCTAGNRACKKPETHRASNSQPCCEQGIFNLLLLGTHMRSVNKFVSCILTWALCKTPACPIQLLMNCSFVGFRAAVSVTETAFLSTLHLSTSLMRGLQSGKLALHAVCMIHDSNRTLRIPIVPVVTDCTVPPCEKPEDHLSCIKNK